MMSREMPRQIGRYEIVRPIGAGGMGEVFLARDPTIDRSLAVKRVLLGHSEEAEELKQRLLREARAAGRLIHPHVVTLFDAGAAEDGLFLAFELVDGPDLGRRMKSPPPLSLGEVLEIARQVASALDYAHGEGIVHRDIKPGNILIGSRGEAKVADFGLAKLHGESLELTRTGSVVGSPQYMSPEQVRGETLDGRSDLFSFGVVLYEMLSRARPFTGQTISTLVYEILSKEPKDISELRPGLSPRLVQLVRRLLAKSVDDRPTGFGEVLGELQALQREIPPALLTSPVSDRVDDEAPTARVPTSTPSLPPSAATVGPPPPVPPVAPAPPVGMERGAEPTVRLDQSPLPTSPPTPLPSGSSAGTPPPPLPLPSSGSVGPRPASAPPRAVAPPAEDPGLRRRAGLAALVLVALGLFVVGGGAGLYLFRHDILAFLGQGSEEGGGGEGERGKGSSSSEGEDEEGSGGDEDGDRGQKESGAGDEEGAGSGSDSGSDESSDRDFGTEDAQVSDSASDAVSDGRSDDASERGSIPGSDGGAGRGGDGGIAEERSQGGRDSGGAHVDRGAGTPGSGSPGSGSTDSGSVDAGTTPGPGRGESTPRPGGGGQTTPRVDPHLARFDAAAAEASRELSGGRYLRFQVSPPNAFVRAWRRGEERGWLLGRAEDFAVGEKKAGDAELPDAGDYLLTLVAEGWPEKSFLVHAEGGRGAGVQVIRASLEQGQAGPTVLRVERSVSFSGNPADARVLVDGMEKGPASQWPGGGRAGGRRHLQLDPGRHVVRLEATGYEPFEIEVEVVATARTKTETIRYRLERR